MKANTEILHTSNSRWSQCLWSMCSVVWWIHIRALQTRMLSVRKADKMPSNCHRRSFLSRFWVFIKIATFYREILVSGIRLRRCPKSRRYLSEWTPTICPKRVHLCRWLLSCRSPINQRMPPASDLLLFANFSNWPCNIFDANYIYKFSLNCRFDFLIFRDSFRRTSRVCFGWIGNGDSASGIRDPSTSCVCCARSEEGLERNTPIVLSDAWNEAALCHFRRRQGFWSSARTSTRKGFRCTAGIILVCDFTSVKLNIWLQSAYLMPNIAQPSPNAALTQMA